MPALTCAGCGKRLSTATLDVERLAEERVAWRHDGTGWWCVTCQQRRFRRNGIAAILPQELWWRRRARLERTRRLDQLAYRTLLAVLALAATALVVLLLTETM